MFKKIWLTTFTIVVIASQLALVQGTSTKKEEWELGEFIKHDDINPIMGPRNDTEFLCPIRLERVKWEEKDVFNPTALVRNGSVYLLYRAEDVAGVFKGTSRIGLAVSTDGYTFERETLPIFYPMYDSVTFLEWEGGCEDPRIVEDESGTYYMTYTAYNGTLAILMVATSTDLHTWTKHGPTFQSAYGGKYYHLWSKSGSIVTRREGSSFIATKINGSYWMYFGDSSIFAATSDDLIHWSPVEDDKEEILKVFGPREGKFDSLLVEPGPQSILEADGIHLIYNSANSDPLIGGDPDLPLGTYSAGQVLMDPQNPTKVLARLEENFFKPDKDYEIVGQVNNVVFLEGLVYFRDCYFLYYGTADSKIAVASYSPSNPGTPCV